MQRAVCYIRVSTEEQAKEGVSLDAQRERLEAYCTMAGLQIVHVIREEGVSAAKPLSTRPGGTELLKMIKAQNIQHVVALKLDRLFRNAEDCLSQTRQWDKAGVGLHLVDMGGATINTASAMGRMFLTMAAGFAELERNLIAERTQGALAHKKRHLEVYTSTPYGFDRDGKSLVPNTKEQKVLAEIRKMSAEGASLRAIARHLNTKGIPTKQAGTERKGKAVSGEWAAATVRFLLANSLYTQEIVTV